MAVIVEATLISAVHDSRSKQLGLIIIENDGTGDSEVGNYNIIIKESGVEGVTSDKIFGFNRKESVFHLICRALNKMGYAKPSQQPSQQQEGKDESCNSPY